MNADFIGRLEEAIRARDAHRKGHETKFLCPAHADTHPSADWSPDKHVWICRTCGAGGGAYALAKLLDVELPDEERGLTVEALAEAKGLPAEFLRSLGVADSVAGIERRPCVDIPYSDASGEMKAMHKRLRFAGDRFRWRKGDPVLPYGLTRLDAARSFGRIFVFEGETDTWTFWLNGLAALGLPGSDTWKESFRRYLDGFDEVYVWREPGKGGDTFVSKMALDLPEIRVISAPLGIKDVNELWLAAGLDRETFVERLKPLIAAARPASQIRAEALTEEARQAREKADALLSDPNLLKRIEQAIQESGYAGNITPAMLVYLGITSRLLERPMNQGIIAPSAAGKNAAVDAALPFFPQSAYYAVDAGSPRSLIYNDEDLRHRIVIFSEADSIPKDDSTAASALRTLATKQVLTYDVTEKDSATGRWTVRRITREGPTGLITTSTKPFDEQWSTRMLQFGVDDTPDQTRLVLAAHAASVNGHRPEVDTSEFVALQTWLALGGDHEVTVPFAHALSRMVPIAQIRMRRDFRQLLTAIQSVALLYQCQRQRDENGRIVATLDDYRMARELVLDTFTSAASGGVTKEVRQVVSAVAEIAGTTSRHVTKKEVALKIGLSISGAWYRVTKALDLGYLVNEETRQRQPAKLVIGDPLPEDKPALPTEEHVRAAREGEPTPDTGRNVESPLESWDDVDTDADSIDDSGAAETATETQPSFGFHSAEPPEEAPIQRFKPNRRSGITTQPSALATAAMRGYLLGLAAAKGWPELAINAAESIVGSSNAWQLFATKASVERLELVTHLLEVDPA